MYILPLVLNSLSHDCDSEVKFFFFVQTNISQAPLVREVKIKSKVRKHKMYKL